MIATEKETILKAFEQFGEHVQRDTAMVDTVRCEAAEALRTLPIPGRKTEAWKYTSTAAVVNQQWAPPSQGAAVDIAALDLPDLDAHLIVMVDGYFRPEYSHPGTLEGLVMLPISEAMVSESEHFLPVFGQQADHQKDLFVALNTAYAKEGLYLRVMKNIRLARPIHLVQVLTQEGTAALSRNVFIAEPGSEGHLVHSLVHLSTNSFSNTVSEVRVENNARFTIDQLQNGNTESRHYSSEEVYLGRDSFFTQNTITSSGAWTRNEPHVSFYGENAICYLNGAYFPSANEHVDNHSIIDHQVPNCESHELYKGVVLDKGKGVFNGKVFVRPDAQKTNAFQQNANILMSDQASVNSKPELEIYADDVKCSHGSTTGQLDTEALFYLQCRGLNKGLAKKMLVHAFIGEVIERLSFPESREYVWRKLEKELD